MKRILMLGVALVMALPAAFAQDYQGKIADTTISNAATPSYVVNVRGAKRNVTFQYAITKNSGTVAGSIALQGSIDGATWATLNTYTLTDATASTSVAYDYAAFTRYRVLITTTGTLNANFKIWALYRN